MTESDITQTSEGAAKAKRTKRNLATAIIATIVFFVVSFIGTAVFDNVATWIALIDSAWKAALGGFFYYFIYAAIARLARW